VQFPLRMAIAIVCTAGLGGSPTAAQSQQASQQQPASQQQSSKPDKNAEHVTVTGCLSVNPESRLYVLTTTPKGIAGTAGAVGNPPTTITYELSGGNGLQKEVGSEVEVVGTTERDQAKTVQSETKQEGTPRNGQTSNAKPKVQTKAETKVTVRALHVDSFRHIASNCKPTAQ
jgi:hypothetical protein